MKPPVLQVEGLCKAFPGVQALQQISLAVRPGEIHALVGENGAGKSTLMNVLAGIVRKDSGSILLDGHSIDPVTPAQAISLGISSVHQEISLAPNLSVAENIFVGCEPTRFGLLRRKKLREETARLLTGFGVSLAPEARVASLSLAMRQIVEIGRGLARQPKLLMLDEPTTSLEPHEVTRLAVLLRDLARQGIGILYVTHKLKELFDFADTVTVLRDGKWVATEPVGQLTTDKVVSFMVGRELSALYPHKSSRVGEEILRVQELTLRGHFENVSFRLRRGELLGLAGLVGAGRSEVAQTIFGYRMADSGRVWLGGKETRITSPAEAVRLGIGYLPEDRKSAGLFRQMSLKDNLFSASLPKYSRCGWMADGAMARTAAGWVDRLGIRASSIDRPISFLSGGNQQKALLGRWLEANPSVLFVDEPTRGIDVGAKFEIHALLRDLCERGIGLAVISSELPEILGLCDRVIVLHEGQVAGELDAAHATEEAIMRLATGQSDERKEESACPD